MSDMKDLYGALARGKALRSHAEECNRAISRQADRWLQKTGDVSKRMNIDEGGALDSDYNADGALRLARDRDTLRKLRDGN